MAASPSPRSLSHGTDYSYICGTLLMSWTMCTNLLAVTSLPPGLLESFSDAYSSPVQTCTQVPERTQPQHTWSLRLAEKVTGITGRDKSG